RIGLLPGGRLAARGNRDDLDKAEAADRVDVMGADETRAHEAHADTGGHESVLGARYMVLRPSKVHGPSSRAPRTLGPRTSDQGLRTKDGPRTEDGPRTKNEGPRTLRERALLELEALLDLLDRRAGPTVFIFDVGRDR